MKSLKTLQQPRTLAELRVTRKTNVGVVHKGESHGWAVSYADLLMVLLSFFVLYFNFDESSGRSREDQFRDLTFSLNGVSQGAGHATSTSGTSATAGEQTITDLSKALVIEGAVVSRVEDRLILAFEKTTFPKGGWRVGRDLKSQVGVVVERLKPYFGQIEVTVIGHADKKVLIPRNLYLQDNFDLSSLRALGVLKHMKTIGFPENKASARAASSFDRDSRSVSLEIRLAKASKGLGS